MKIFSRFALLLCLTACNAPSRDSIDTRATTQTAGIGPSGTVDSIFPMPVMIERFQGALPRRTDALDASAPRSRDELVARLMRAVLTYDANTLDSLRIDAPEFGYIYFPTSQFSRRPFEQPPAVEWMLTDQASKKGERQLLKHFGGRTVTLMSHACEHSAMEGPNRVWSDCSVVLLDMAGNSSTLRMTGSILERDGRYKFVSLANGL